MGFIKKEMTIGFVVGLLVTLAGGFLYLEFFTPYTFEESILTLFSLENQMLLGKILSIAAIPNLAVFFLFLKKEKINIPTLDQSNMGM